MYNPYGNAPQGQPGFQGQGVPQNLQHPQPHAATFQTQYGQQQQQQQHPQTGVHTGYPNFINDQAASIASQFAKNQFETSNQYLQQSFGTFLPGTSDLKYYFKVSNSYVLKKILIVLFPYHHKNWNRITTAEVTGEQPSASQNQFAPPNYDVNAPDLYIPLVAFVTYILLWASFQGLKGDFHPQLFGYLASQTLAFSFLDIAIFKIGLYLLNCSTQSSLWDLVSFSGYKYISIIVLLIFKHIVGDSWMIYYPVIFFFIINLAVFLMRSLRFLVLPNYVTGTSNSITTGQRRIRVQFLFVYSLIIQGLIILYMSR